MYIDRLTAWPPVMTKPHCPGIKREKMRNIPAVDVLGAGGAFTSSEWGGGENGLTLA